jgi:hypothetical protein
MLVRVARGAYYKKGSQYIVYAIEETASRISYAVYPVGELSNPSAEVDPFYVQAGVFDVVADRVTQQWTAQEFQGGGVTKQVKSFPEYFSIEGFWHRHNDLSLQESDYEVIRAYKTRYESIYADLIE